LCRNLRDGTSERRNIGGIDGDVLFDRNDLSDVKASEDWNWGMAPSKNPRDVTSRTVGAQGQELTLSSVIVRRLAILLS
jgi:hypothetical protein